MSDEPLHEIEVRPILPGERAGFDAGLDEHHWLGRRLVGRTMRYVLPRVLRQMSEDRLVCC